MALFNAGKKEKERGKKEKNLPAEASHIEQGTPRKFNQPKILLIDVDTAVEEAVKENWGSVVMTFPHADIPGIS